MSTAVVRTADGWWVEKEAARLHRIATSARTTAELLADRTAVETAAGSADPGEPAEGRQLLSPVTAPCRVVAQMVVPGGWPPAPDPKLMPSAILERISIQ